MQSRPESTRSTLGTWSAALLRAVEARGADADAIARELGLDRTALGPEQRVPRETLNRLWELAVAATGDPALGLDAPRHTSQTTFHALGYAVLASATLKDAFERIVRWRRLIGDVLSMRLVDLGDRYRLEIDVSGDPGIPYHAVDAIASLCVRQARALHRPRPCNPLLVTFAHPEPFDVKPYTEVFRAPVRFGADANAIELARADVDDPLPAGNAELARGNDEVLARFLARQEQARVATRVQQALLEALPDGAPSKTTIARKLGMSARTLQRHLADEGTSFKDVLDDARADLAKTYVEEQRLTITEIAFVLGFADTSAFSRAFKRWTGMSPRDWAKRRGRAG